jgi:hypothetical protein
MLAATGAATLSGSWVRVFMNNEAYGLFLMIDDASTHFIDDVLHGGNWQYPNTGEIEYLFRIDCILIRLT